MRPADQIVSESFLEVRAKLLEVAATMDRVDRSIKAGDSLGDSAAQQRELISAAIEICGRSGVNRAEQLQLLFSRDYDQEWRKQMQV